jgi:hypothetical protein
VGLHIRESETHSAIHFEVRNQLCSTYRKRPR